MRIRCSLVKSLVFGILFFTVFFGMTTITWAEKKEEGMYFSLMGVENYVEGDFDGNATGEFAVSTVFCRIPKIERGRGFGILIGGYKEKIAGELYYMCSNHDTSFGFSDLNGNGTYNLGEEAIYYKDGEYQAIGANIKYYFANLFDKNLRFSGQLGLFVPRISVEQGAYQENQFNTTADVTFSGYGADLGLGVLIHVHSNLAINGAAVFRHIRIKEVTAFDQDRVPTKSIYGNGRSYSVGLNYYF